MTWSRRQKIGYYTRLIEELQRTSSPGLARLQNLTGDEAEAYEGEGEQGGFFRVDLYHDNDPYRYEPGGSPARRTYLHVETEFRLLSSNTLIKKYSDSQPYGDLAGRESHGNENTLRTQLTAFEAAIENIHQKILEDPPANYIDAAHAALRAETQELDEDLENLSAAQVRQREAEARDHIIGDAFGNKTPFQILEALIDIRQRAIRRYPTPEGENARGQYELGEQAHDSIFRGRLTYEQETIIEELLQIGGPITILDIKPNVTTPGQQPRSEITYTTPLGPGVTIGEGGPRVTAMKSRYEELGRVMRGETPGSSSNLAPPTPRILIPPGSHDKTTGQAEFDRVLYYAVIIEPRHQAARQAFDEGRARGPITEEKLRRALSSVGWIKGEFRIREAIARYEERSALQPPGEEQIYEYFDTVEVTYTDGTTRTLKSDPLTAVSKRAIETSQAIHSLPSEIQEAEEQTRLLHTEMRIIALLDEARTEADRISVQVAERHTIEQDMTMEDWDAYNADVHQLILPKLDQIESDINHLRPHHMHNGAVPSFEEQVARIRELIQPVLDRSAEIDADIAQEEDRRRERALEQADDVEWQPRLMEFIVVDNVGRSMEFKLFLAKNDKSIQVQVIKRFLGLELSAGDLFDESTKRALMEWQDSNSRAILKLAAKDYSYGPIPASASPTMNEHFLEEYGRVGPITFMVMNGSDLKKALTEVLNYNSRILMDGSTPPDTDSIETLSKRKIGDGENPPWSDAKYHYYIYNTEATRETINSDGPDNGAAAMKAWYDQNAEKALRESILELFDYHARQKTWKVYGNRTGHQVFNSLLFYQNKITERKMSDRQEFTLTAESQTLAENLGVRDDEYTPKVDVLFGQNLSAEASPIFASIVKFHGPTPRPGSTWKLQIRVRRDMFDKIPTIESRTLTIGQTIAKARAAAAAVKSAVDALPESTAAVGATALEKKKAVENAISEKSRSIGRALGSPNHWSKKERKAAIEKGAAGALGLAKKFSRDAEMAKQFGSPDGPAELSTKQQLAFAAALKAIDIGTESFPITTSYEINMINEKIEAVAKMFEAWHAEILDWRTKGGRMRPYIDVKEEAKHLRALIPAITSLLSANGRVKRDFARKKDRIELTFDEVFMERSVQMPPYKAGPNKGKPQPPITVADRAGAVPLLVNYIPEGKSSSRLQQGTLTLGQKYPWNLPRTMNYLANLNSLYDAATDRRSCWSLDWNSENLELSGDSGSERTLELLRYYTMPTLFIIPRDPKPIFDIKQPKIDIDGPIKRFNKKLNEDLGIEGEGPLSRRWREGIIRFEKNKTYPITDPVPTIELCTLESLFEEFLDKFDFPALFCDYASCIPDLPWPPHFSWDMNFTLPELPRLPTFDPIAIIIPRIELALTDLVLSFLCGLVRGILDIIKFPDCQDLLNFGKAAWEDVWADPDRTTHKLKIFQDATAALGDMDIPPQSYPDMSSLFDDLAMMLTPAELCSLLDGSADQEVIAIVLELIRKRYSAIAAHLKNESDIITFFSLLGRFVDPDLCNRVSNISNVILGDVLCPDGRESVRSRLESQRATPQEISQALADAAEQRAALKSLLEKDPLEGLIPGPGQDSIPGPYDNPLSDNLAELAVTAVMDNIELLLKNDLVSYAPSLMDTVHSQKEPGDPGFDPLGYAEYQFVRGQVETFEQRGLQISLRLRRLDDVSQEGEGGEEEIRRQAEALERDVGVRDDLSSLDIQGIHVQKGENGRYYLRIAVYDEEGDLVPTGAPIAGGGVAIDGVQNGGGIDLDQVYPVIQSYLSSLMQDALSSMARPSALRVHPRTGEYFCDHLRIDGEPAFFDLAIPSEIQEITNILTFPLRNMKPETKILPWLQDVLDNPSLVNTTEIRGAAGFDFMNINNQFKENPRRRRANEDRMLEIKMALDPRPGTEKFMTYQEIPFNLGGAKDCYNLHRPSRLSLRGGGFFQETVWKGKTYNVPIPQDIFALRNRARDTQQVGLKLLRPGAFADMVLNSWSRASALLPEDINNISAEKVEGYETEIWKKLQGLGPGEDVAKNAYGHMAARFNEKLASRISDSRFFDFEEIMKLSHLITAEFVESVGEDQKICFVENTPILDFEKLRKDLIKRYKESLSNSENRPENRDFSKPGPLEDSIGSSMALLYVRTFIIEFMLRGIFVFSVYAPSSVFRDPMISDYIADFLRSSIDADMSLNSADRFEFIEEIQKAANETDLAKAVEILMAKAIEDSNFIATADRIFSPSFNSFKEDFFGELLRDATYVQPLKNIAPAPGNSKNGTRRGFVPLHSSFGGPIGLSTESLRDFNKGKFYVENYFRFSEDFIDQFFLPDQSLMKRLIDRFTPPDLYSPTEFSGVFSKIELDRLFRFIDIIDARLEVDAQVLMGAALEEWNIFMERMSEPGTLKAGKRLVFLPGKMSDETVLAGSTLQEVAELGGITEQRARQDNAVAISRSTNQIYGEDIFEGRIEDRDTFSIFPEPLANFHHPGDVPSLAEVQAMWARDMRTLGRPSEEYRDALAAVQHLLAIAPALQNQYIDELPLTMKTRSYVADTNPHRSFQRAPRVREGSEHDWHNQPAHALGASHIMVGDDEDSLVAHTSGAPKNIMFPTPLVEREVDMCASDLLNAYLQEFEAGTPGVQSGVYVDAADRQLTLELFGIDTSTLTMVQDPALEIKYLFDFIFPLDRYQALFLMQNQILLDGSKSLSVLLDPTRSAIKRMSRTLKNTNSLALNAQSRTSSPKMYSLMVSDKTSTGPGTRTKAMLGDYGEAITKIAAMAVPTLIRGQAAYLDPAYKELKHQFDTNVCKMSTGLTPGIIRSSLTYEPFESGPVLENGFDEDKKYSPFNVQGPLDLSVCLAALGIGVSTPNNFRELLRIVEHLSNAITGGQPRYGKFLTPIGLLALSMPELDGEKYREKKREAECVDDTPTAKPFILCKDVEEEEQ